MLIVMDRSATNADVERVVAAAERLGLTAHPIPGAQRTAVGITGNPGPLDPDVFAEDITYSETQMFVRIIYQNYYVYTALWDAP